MCAEEAQQQPMLCHSSEYHAFERMRDSATLKRVRDCEIPLSVCAAVPCLGAHARLYHALERMRDSAIPWNALVIAQCLGLC